MKLAIDTEIASVWGDCQKNFDAVQTEVLTFKEEPKCVNSKLKSDIEVL